MLCMYVPNNTPKIISLLRGLLSKRGNSLNMRVGFMQWGMDDALEVALDGGDFKVKREMET